MKKIAGDKVCFGIACSGDLNAILCTTQVGPNHGHTCEEFDSKTL
jgi:hypothetical protein